MHRHHPVLARSAPHCRGVGLVELSFGLIVLAAIITALIQHQFSTYRGVRFDREKAFAFAKAQAILAEIQALAEESKDTSRALLDDLDDGGRLVPTLTITKDGAVLVDPDHPLSENFRRGTHWVWSRSISVRPLTGVDNKSLRYVTVSIHRRELDHREREFASVSTVVNAFTTSYPATQVYDVFFINIESVPGWWVMMESITPFAEAVLGELQSLNPGLEIRSHWITKASYGRNPVYRPYANLTADSRQPSTEAYYYPGRMPAGSQTTFYYPPERFHARMSIDGTEKNGYDADLNPYPYALADFYNHAMRYPQEKELHELRVNAVRERRKQIAEALALGLEPPPELNDMSEEPTLRLLLEDLNSNPEKYRNAMIINLHGELMPFPPLRNYSDAAKVPDKLPDVRVVTHPEQLRTMRNAAPDSIDRIRVDVVDLQADSQIEPFASSLGDAAAALDEGSAFMAASPADPTSADLALGKALAAINAAETLGLDAATALDFRTRIETQRTYIWAPPPAPEKPEDVALRVYAWTTQPGSYTGPATMPAERPIVLQVMDLDLAYYGGPVRRLVGKQAVETPMKGMVIENLRGGVDVDGSKAYYPMAAAKAVNDTSLLTGEMYYDLRFVDPGAGQRKYTLIYLYQTPVVCPPVVDGMSTRGLYANERSRLYGLEYVPCCTESAHDFSRNLYTVGDGPKNTARWRISIPAEAFWRRRFVTAAGRYYNPASDVQLTIRTRILDPGLADPLASGTMYPTAIQPENLSETYTWWADSKHAVPWTERAQFQGDPRHNPYRDLLTGDPDYPDGYNWYHSSLVDDGESAASDMPGLRAASLGSYWETRMAIDVPRLMELLRRGLVESKCVFSAMNGWSFYYLGIGNDIGADAANGYPNSIPVDLQAWGSPNVDGYANNITTSRCFVRSATTSPELWWGIPWLGELCPDWAWASDWFAPDADGKPRGNLKTGLAADQFYRSPIATVYADSSSRRRAYGTVLKAAQQRSYQRGCTTVFNIGSSAGTFCHQSTNLTATLTTAGEQVAGRYGIVMPNTLAVTRPFSLTNTSYGVPAHWAYEPYVSGRYTASPLVDLLAPSGSVRTGALIELQNPTKSSSGFFFVNGIGQSVDVGTDLIARICILCTLHSFFELGTSTNPNRPPLLPRVEISNPTAVSEIIDPTQVSVHFDIQWTRWDKTKYTWATPDDFTESEGDLRYVLLLSKDNGHTWRHLQSDNIALPGTFPDETSDWIADQNSGAPEVITFSTPSATFPKGRYQLRVEVHRPSQAMHYAWHQVDFFIDR